MGARCVAGPHALGPPAHGQRGPFPWGSISGGDSNSLRIAHIGSLDFVRGLPDLEELLLQCLTVDSLDYSPLLSLKKLKVSWVKKSCGMMPAYEDLAETLPGWDG